MQMRDPISFDETVWTTLSHQIIASLGLSSLCGQISLLHSCVNTYTYSTFKHISDIYQQKYLTIYAVGSNDSSDSNSKPFCDRCEQYLYPASLLHSQNSSSQKINTTTTTITTSSGKQPQPWLPDNSAAACMICSRDFSVMVRRHHCRKVNMLLWIV